jgi:glycosyltransferase involved in cell wall biosynthesis
VIRHFDELSINQHDNQITYDIYGPVKDKIYWNKCLQVIASLPKNISVNYNGDIPPSEIKAALGKSHIFILPSKSENFGHAIYEALSAGRPVITSNNTPWNNLRESNAGINVSTDQINVIIEAINFFAKMTQEELDKWSLAAHQYAIQSVDFDMIRQQYKEMFLGEV